MISAVSTICGRWPNARSTCRTRSEFQEFVLQSENRRGGTLDSGRGVDGVSIGGTRPRCTRGPEVFRRIGPRFCSRPDGVLLCSFPNPARSWRGLGVLPITCGRVKTPTACRIPYGRNKDTSNRHRARQPINGASHSVSRKSAQGFNPQAIAFDPWGIAELERILSEEGITLPPFKQFGQGYKSMSPATKAFEERVFNRRLVHSGNPVLTWAISNVSLERDAAGNVKPSKARSRERIDPAISGVLASDSRRRNRRQEYDFSGNRR